MPFRVGPMEMIILLVIVMMVFGVGKLPQVGGSIGKALREFRKAQEIGYTPEEPEVASPSDAKGEDERGRA